MTIAERLNAIAQIVDEKQRHKAALDFSGEICNHPQEKILNECITRAKFGCTNISLGRNPFVPEGLAEEGFYILVDGSGFLLSFASKSKNWGNTQPTRLKRPAR